MGTVYITANIADGADRAEHLLAALDAALCPPRRGVAGERVAGENGKG